MSLEIVVAAAKSAGHRVEVLPACRGGSGRPILLSYVMVDGEKCSVHTLTNVFKPKRGQYYARGTLVRSRLETTDGQIVYIDPPIAQWRQILKVPSPALLSELFSGGQDRVTIYVGLEYPPQNPAFDFASYATDWRVEATKK